MKKVFIASMLALLSISSFADDLTGNSSEKISISNEVTGDAAREIYNKLKAYEYKTGTTTSLLVYNLTVRHNEILECQKEETQYVNDNHIDTTYKCVMPTVSCTDSDHKLSIQLTMKDNSVQLYHEDRVFDCNKLATVDSLITCTAIDFETAGAIVLKIFENKIGNVEILPPPGSGKIEQNDLTCSVI
jgi:hypothetical protein